MPDDEVQYVHMDHTRTEQEARNQTQEGRGVHAIASPTPYVILLPLFRPSDSCSSASLLPLTADEKDCIGPASFPLHKTHPRRMYALYEGLPHPGNNYPTCYMMSLEDETGVDSCPPMLLELQAQGPPQGFAQTFFIGEDRVVPQVSTLIASPVDLHFLLLRILFDSDRCAYRPEAGVGEPSVASLLPLASDAHVCGTGWTPPRDGSVPSCLLPRALPFRSAEEWLDPLPLLSLRTEASLPSSGTHRSDTPTEVMRGKGATVVDLLTGSPRFTGQSLPFYGISCRREDATVGVSDGLQDALLASGEGEEEEAVYDDGESFFQHLRAMSRRERITTLSTERRSDLAFPHSKREREADEDEDDDANNTQKAKVEGKEMGWWKRWVDTMQEEEEEEGDHLPLMKEAMQGQCGERVCTSSGTRKGNYLQHFFQSALPSLLEDFCETTTFVTHASSCSASTPPKVFGDAMEKEATTYFQPSWLKAALWVARRVRMVQGSTALRTFLQLPPPVALPADVAAQKGLPPPEISETRTPGSTWLAAVPPHAKAVVTTGGDGEARLLQKAALAFVTEYIPAPLLHGMRQAVQEKMASEKREACTLGTEVKDDTMNGGALAASSLEREKEGRIREAITNEERLSYAECWALLQEGERNEAPTSVRHHHAESTLKVEETGRSDTAKKTPGSRLLPALRRLQKDGKLHGTPTLDAFFSFSASKGKTEEEKKNM